MIDLIRENYENEVKELENLAIDLQNTGSGIWDTAKLLHEARRFIGIKYKFKRSLKYRNKIFKRNLEKYNNIFGPSFEYLEKKYNFRYEEIIKASYRVNKDYENLKKEKNDDFKRLSKRMY